MPNRRRLRAFVLIEGVTPVTQGVVVGLLLCLVPRGLLRLILGVEISVFEVVPIVGLTIGLTLIAAVACYLPAHRASAVNPAEVLRAQ